MNVLALRLRAKPSILGGEKAACKWEVRSVPECYGRQQLCCCDFYKPSRVRFNGFLPLSCFPCQFWGGGGAETYGFLSDPRVLRSLIKALGVELFLRASWETSGWSELSCAWFQAAAAAAAPAGAAAAARGSCYCLFQRDRTAFLFGNPLRHSCWSVTWASSQLTYPDELNAVFWLPSWCQFKECFNEDRWRMLDHYFKTWQIADWACFPAITANCIGTLEYRGGKAEFHGFLYI